MIIPTGNAKLAGAPMQSISPTRGRVRSATCFAQSSEDAGTSASFRLAAYCRVAYFFWAMEQERFCYIINAKCRRRPLSGNCAIPQRPFQSAISGTCIAKSSHLWKVDETPL